VQPASVPYLIVTRGNTGQYENTTPASGPRYAPNVEKGKGEGEAE
jgi:hypothetical protein